MRSRVGVARANEKGRRGSVGRYTRPHPPGAHQNDRSRSGHAWPGVPLLCRRLPDELTSIHRRPQQRPQRSSPRSRKSAFDGARLALSAAILSVLSASLSWRVRKPSSFEPYRLCPVVAQLLVHSSHFLIQNNILTVRIIPLLPNTGGRAV